MISEEEIKAMTLRLQDDNRILQGSLNSVRQFIDEKRKRKDLTTQLKALEARIKNDYLYR